MDKISKTNDTDDLLCGPCNVENKHSAAIGYCQYCRHYLCTTCYNYHKNLGKIHVLLNQDVMPRAKLELTHLQDPCMETCKDHKHKTIELYCKNHDEVCCVICVTLHHKKCDYVYIPEFTDALDKTSTDYSQSLMNMIQELIQQYDMTKTELAFQNKEIVKKRKDFGSAVRKLKKEINEILDELEKQVTTEMWQTFEKETKLITDNVSKCEEAMKALAATYTSTKAVLKTDKPNKIFTLTRLSHKHVRDLHTCLKTVQNNTFQVDMKFEPNLEIVRSLRKLKNFGKMICKRTVVKIGSREGSNSIENSIENKRLSEELATKQQESV